jgi:mRNA interferase YafQ
MGEYKDCMECHIESDTLLIWIDENTNIVKLIRLGTHSELFK